MSNRLSAANFVENFPSSQLPYAYFLTAIFAGAIATLTFRLSRRASAITLVTGVNIGILGAALKFDQYPFGLLTMIVSLEAIFLSTFVMVSQNRQAERSDIRSQLDFETNLRAEIWAVHIGAQLGIETAHVEDVIRDAIAATTAETG